MILTAAARPDPRATTSAPPRRWRAAFLALALLAAPACAKPPEAVLNAPVTQGTVSATLTSYEVRYLDLEGPTGAVQTDQPVLVLNLTVANNGAGPVNYDLGWSTTSATQAQSALLFVDQGPEVPLSQANYVPAVLLTSLQYLPDPVTAPTAISPGQTLTDVLLFQLPPAGSSALVLSLPPRIFGAEAKLPAYIRFPFSVPAEVPATAPIALGETWQGDGFEFSVTSAEIAWVRLNDSTQGAGFSNQPLLRLNFSVRNPGTELMQYSSARQGGLDMPVLKDETGATISRAQFGANVTIEGALASGRVQVNPGEAISDFLLFERPPQGITSLTFTIPGKRFGSSGLVRVRVPYAWADPPEPEELHPPQPGSGEGAVPPPAPPNP